MRIIMFHGKTEKKISTIANESEQNLAVLSHTATCLCFSMSPQELHRLCTKTHQTHIVHDIHMNRQTIIGPLSSNYLQ